MRKVYSSRRELYTFLFPGVNDEREICVMGKFMPKRDAKRTAKYKLKVKKQKGINHSKSRLRGALAKATNDFNRDKEEKEERIKSLSK